MSGLGCPNAWKAFNPTVGVATDAAGVGAKVIEAEVMFEADAVELPLEADVFELPLEENTSEAGGSA